MKTKPILVAMTLAIALTTTSAALAAQAKAGEPAAPVPPPAIAELLAKIQAQDAPAADKLAQELVRLGPSGIADLCGLVVEPGKIDDSKARFAIHGLAVHVSRPGADAERQTVCEVFRKMVTGPAPAAVKGFFLRQLRIMACPKAVEAIGECLLNEELCEYAAQALLSIGGEAAADAMLKALPKAQGKCRLTLIQDLGVAREARSAPDLLKAANDLDREVRLAALSALGNIGVPGAAETLTRAAEADGLYERSRATDALLLLARRLGEAGSKPEAERIYRHLWNTRTDPRDRHVRCAAIRGLAIVLGAGAMNDILAALKSDDLQIRTAAIEAAVATPGEDITANWVRRMEGLPPAGRADILAILARRGGPAAEGAVLAAIKDADENVRLAATAAAASFKGDRLVPALLACLASEKGKWRDAARRSLERLGGDEASAAIAAAMPAAAKDVRRDLLAILAARGARGQAAAVLAATKDEDGGVRQAALGALEVLADERQAPDLVALVVKARDDGERSAAEKALGGLCGRMVKKETCVEQILPALAGADPPAKAALIRVLAKAAGPKALDAVRAALKDADATIQEAGVRALSDWPDPAVAPDLLEIAMTAAKQTSQVLALRGYVRLANVPPDRPAAEKLKMYEQAMAAAKRPDEKRLVLGALGEMRLLDALKMAAPLMGDETVKEEAAATVVRIARNLGDDVRKDDAKAEVKAAVTKALQIARNENVRKDAESVLQRIERK